MEQQLLRLIIQEMPIDKNGDLIFDVDEARELHKNAVNISGGTVSQDVYGGNSAGGNANGNTVTITGGTVGTESGWALTPGRRARFYPGNGAE